MKELGTFLDNLKIDGNDEHNSEDYEDKRQEINQKSSKSTINCRRNIKIALHVGTHVLLLELLGRTPFIDLAYSRPSGDPRSTLHILGLNPTFATEDDAEMLDESCWTMSMVVECGFTHANAYGTDIFPLKVDLKLMDTMDSAEKRKTAKRRRVAYFRRRRDPFKSFPQFKEIFNCHLDKFLRWGKVLLVFGEVAWSYVERWLDVEELKLNAFPNLELFIELKVLRIWSNLTYRTPQDVRSEFVVLSSKLHILPFSSITELGTRLNVVAMKTFLILPSGWTKLAILLLN